MVGAGGDTSRNNLVQKCHCHSGNKSRKGNHLQPFAFKGSSPFTEFVALFIGVCQKFCVALLCSVPSGSEPEV